MAHRKQGAASMVADVEAVTALCELQQRLKVHAINGNPADAGIWALVACIGRDTADGTEAPGQSSCGQP
jgi:hypothetical protein